MIRTILAGAAGVIAAPAVGGLAYRKARQRRVARALVIDTPNGIVEQRFCESLAGGPWGIASGFGVRHHGMTHNGSGAHPGCLGDELSAVVPAST